MIGNSRSDYWIFIIGVIVKENWEKKEEIWWNIKQK